MSKDSDDDGVSDAFAPSDAPSESAEPASELPTDPSAQEVLDLLAEGVPMALVADLIDPAGPPSPVILEEEGLPDEAWWAPDFTPRPADDDAPGDGPGDGPAGDATERDV